MAVSMKQLLVVVALFGAVLCQQEKQDSKFHVLSRTGKLAKVQLVFPVGTAVSKETEAVRPFVLTPDGRLEQIVQQPQPQEVQLFELTSDGRLQNISLEDLPQEENGEYHVILPNGSLQRVRFQTVKKNNKLSATVMYQEVEPLQGPLYKYAAPLVQVA